MITVSNVSLTFGGQKLFSGADLKFMPGNCYGVIGANGAGKSSTLRTIAGLVKPSGGTINFRGDNITGRDATTIVKKGITLVPEGRRVFAQMTVEENLEMGAFTRANSTVEPGLEKVYELFPRLKERRRQVAGTLSGGEQQMLAMGRALMSRPDLVMLDEPSLGLAPLLVREIFDIILKINAEGKTVLLVEQNALAALSIAHYAYVLEVGRVVAEAPGQELLKDPKVKEAYLGG